MRRVDIPAARRRLHARAVADEGLIANQYHIADRTLRDVTRLPEAGEVKLPRGAVMVALRTILLRRTAPGSAETVAAENGAAASLHDSNLHMVAAVARMAVTHAVSSPAEQEVFTRRGDRP